MSNILSRVAVCVFALLAMAATYDVTSAGAQQKKPKPVLVSTECKLGVLAACGEEPARVTCSRTVKVDMGWLTETFGFGLGELKCEQIGKVTLYKDRFSSDGTSTQCSASTNSGGFINVIKAGNEDESDEPWYDEEATC